MVPLCNARSGVESGSLEEAVAQSIAAAWVLGDLRQLEGTMHGAKDWADEARPVWEQLIALPQPEQRRRIGALHAAAVSCSGGLLTELTGGASR